jgi:protein-S-isoprenylcysteine O-methyltransferase Ste14
MEGGSIISKELTFKEVLATISNPKLYLNIPTYLFVLTPLTYGIYWVCARPLDAYFNLPPFISTPWNWIVGTIFLLLGMIVVWWSYAYLVTLGKGSPASHLGGTPEFVTIGPYALVRHPSVMGKLLGVIGFGCILRSTTFTFLIIPILLIYSWITNRYAQEIFCVRKWGDAYLKYRREVPLFFPRIKDLITFIRNRGSLKRD